jgi:DNA modification methylase
VAFNEGLSASHPDLVEDIGEVILNRVLRDEERRGYLTVETHPPSSPPSGTSLQFQRETLHGYHPTQKPLRLVRRAIVASTKEGDLVFDPFCGSGTSRVASKELGCFFVGAEKGDEYADLAARRIGAAVRGEVLREIEGARSGL